MLAKQFFYGLSYVSIPQKRFGSPGKSLELWNLASAPFLAAPGPLLLLRPELPLHCLKKGWALGDF